MPEYAAGSVQLQVGGQSGTVEEDMEKSGKSVRPLGGLCIA